jgi:hypothetical protein
MNTITHLRDELRGRRTARANRRALERELATYDTTSHINDLLGSLQGQDGADVQHIREIVLRNGLRHSLHRAS